MALITEGRASAPPPDPKVLVRKVDAGLLVYVGTSPTPSGQNLARSVAKEPGRTLVILDVSLAGEHISTVAFQAIDAFFPDGVDGVRLVVSASPADTERAARDLAELTGAEVVAPIGTVLLLPDGSLFVASEGGYGTWRSIGPDDGPATDFGPRHPAPPWEADLPDLPLESPSGAVAEPIPAGLWVHHGRAAGAEEEEWDDTFRVPAQPDRIMLLVGAPGTPEVDSAELRELADLIGGASRDLVHPVRHSRGPATDDEQEEAPVELVKQDQPAKRAQPSKQAQPAKRAQPAKPVRPSRAVQATKPPPDETARPATPELEEPPLLPLSAVPEGVLFASEEEPAEALAGLFRAWCRQAPPDLYGVVIGREPHDPASTFRVGSRVVTLAQLGDALTELRADWDGRGIALLVDPSSDGSSGHAGPLAELLDVDVVVSSRPLWTDGTTASAALVAFTSVQKGRVVPCVTEIADRPWVRFDPASWRLSGPVSVSPPLPPLSVRRTATGEMQGPGAAPQGSAPRPPRSSPSVEQARSRQQVRAEQSVRQHAVHPARAVQAPQAPPSQALPPVPQPIQPSRMPSVNPGPPRQPPAGPPRQPPPGPVVPAGARAVGVDPFAVGPAVPHSGTPDDPPKPMSVSRLPSVGGPRLPPIAGGPRSRPEIVAGPVPPPPVVGKTPMVQPVVASGNGNGGRARDGGVYGNGTAGANRGGSRPNGARETPEGFRLRHATHTRAITRLLEREPGLSAPPAAGHAEQAFTDLIAARAYAAGDEPDLDDVLRAGHPPDSTSVAGWVAAGMRRLPTVSGAAYRGCALGVDSLQYIRAGQILVEPGFVRATLSVVPQFKTAIEYVIWSRTGRRTSMLGAVGDPEEVIFLPGTSFTVVSVVAEQPGGGPPVGGVVARILLAETETEGETGPRYGTAPGESVVEQLTRAAVARLNASRLGLDIPWPMAAGPQIAPLGVPTRRPPGVDLYGIS